MVEVSLPAMSEVFHTPCSGSGGWWLVCDIDLNTGVLKPRRGLSAGLLAAAGSALVAEVLLRTIDTVVSEPK